MRWAFAVRNGWLAFSASSCAAVCLAFVHCQSANIYRRFGKEKYSRNSNSNGVKMKWNITILENTYMGAYYTRGNLAEAHAKFYGQQNRPTKTHEKCVGLLMHRHTSAEIRRSFICRTYKLDAIRVQTECNFTEIAHKIHVVSRKRSRLPVVFLCFLRAHMPSGWKWARRLAVHICLLFPALFLSTYRRSLIIIIGRISWD